MLAISEAPATAAVGTAATAGATAGGEGDSAQAATGDPTRPVERPVERTDEPLFSVLAYHDFDGARADTGPDTFRVWETTRGRVERSTLFRWSGDVSVEIRDAAGDGDFPELQGYFEKRDSGLLFVHFALLITDPAEPFNVALAGPGGFGLRRYGIVFWLQGRDGRLRHVSDGIPKPLVELAPFTWYQVDLLVDLGAGRYDLALYEEGLDEPAVALTRQPTATTEPGSAVDKFSFIGDVGEDVSRVVYYVDDVVIGTDAPAETAPFMAPGRRRLFVERLPAPDDGEGPAWEAERAGDAALLAGDAAAAEDHYLGALDTGGSATPLLLKLADAYFLLGDLAREKALRERIYGTLDPRPEP